MAKRINAEVYLEVYESEADLDESSKRLLQKARTACDAAYAPYSGYHVGAAVLLGNGEIVSGNNQENAVYPAGLCAERVAMFAASSQFPQVAVLKIAISARKAEGNTFLPVTPCGGCRQVLSEYERLYQQPLQVIMEGPAGKVYSAKSIATLLPFSFSANNLQD